MMFITSAYSTSSFCCRAYSCIPRGICAHFLNRPTSGRTLYLLWCSYSVIVGSFFILRTITAQSRNSSSIGTSNPAPKQSRPLSCSASVYVPRYFRIAPILAEGKWLSSSAYLGARPKFCAHSLMAAMMSSFDAFDMFLSPNKKPPVRVAVDCSGFLGLFYKRRQLQNLKKGRECRTLVIFEPFVGENALCCCAKKALC